MGQTPQGWHLDKPIINIPLMLLLQNNKGLPWSNFVLASWHCTLLVCACLHVIELMAMLTYLAEEISHQQGPHGSHPAVSPCSVHHSILKDVCLIWDVIWEGVRLVGQRSSESLQQISLL